MKIEYARRPQRGVTQLMYVGDDNGDGIQTRSSGRRGLWVAAALGGGVMAVMAEQKGTRQFGLVGALIAGVLAAINP